MATSKGCRLPFRPRLFFEGANWRGPHRQGLLNRRRDFGSLAEPGCLVFADAILVAVISHLEETVDGELQHRWYLEAGFGRCSGAKPDPIFMTKEEAQAWIE